MKIPFETHSIFITLDDEKMYQLFADFSKVEVNQKDILSEFKALHSSQNPYTVLHKKQFVHGKPYALDNTGENGLSEESAKIYHRIGFLSDEELQSFLS